MQASASLFHRLIYIDIIKYTYIRSLMIIEITTEEKCVFFSFHALYSFNMYQSYTAHAPTSAYSQARPYGGECAIRSVVDIKGEFQGTSASFYC